MYKTRHSLQLLIFFVLFLIQIFYILRFKYPINYGDELKQCSTNKLTNQISDRKQINCINRHHGLKSVQVLTQFYDWQFWKDDFLGRKPFENCSQKACFAFRYHSSRQEAFEESDGVIVHAPNLLYLPSRSDYKRNPRQLWSLFTIESQRYSFCLLHFKLNDLDDWFNLTKTVKDRFAYMTYDLKQLHRYDTYLNSFNKSIRLKKNDDVVKSKPNKVIWFVSHCSTPSRREHIVHELRKYIDVDIYGRCGFIGSKTDPCRQSSDPARCLVDLFNSYKFYLSFENSNCDSYITEKYFQFYETSLIFDVDIVPIVRGAKWSQYLERAPDNHSFIFAENFNSIKSLADYLNYLDRNDSAYQEYFSWKVKLNERMFASLSQKQDERLLQPEEFSPMCDLCEKLHDEEYLKSSHPPVKLSDIYNPIKDCSQETFSEKKLLKRLQDSTSCYWAEFHQRFKNFWYVYERLF